MATTWNPADKGAQITLSNGNLTAEAVNWPTYQSVRATVSKSSGKWYWEVYVDTKAYQVLVGVANSSASVSSRAGSDANGWVYKSLNGDKYNNNVSTAYGATFTTGDIIGVALNLDTGKIWFAKNNAWQASGDPAAGTNEAFSGLSGSLYPFGGCDKGSPPNDTQTIRPDDTSQTYSPPAGFSALDAGITSNLFDGKISINSPTNLFDGKVRIKNVTTDLFDGKVRIKNSATDLFDGKVKIVNTATNLFDGKVRIKNVATDLFDGKVRVKDVATDLFDGKVIVTYTGQISASCPTPTGQFTVGKRLAGSVPTPRCDITAVFRYARIDADTPVPTASFRVGRIISGDLPVPDFTCTANVGRYPALVANAPVPAGSMRVGLVLSDVATISHKAGVPVPTGHIVATSAHLATIYGTVPCPLLSCTGDTVNITTIFGSTPCPRGLFEATVGNVADILGRTPCPSCSIVAITGQVITLSGSVPVPGPLVRFLASPMNVNITLSGVVPTPSMIFCVRGLTSLILRHIRGDIR